MFSIIAPASSLYLHTSLAILLSEVALHVHNTPKHAFFYKNVNRKKTFLLLCESKKKKKKKKKILLELEPSTLFADSFSTTDILTAPSNRLLRFTCKYE